MNITDTTNIYEVEFQEINTTEDDCTPNYDDLIENEFHDELHKNMNAHQKEAEKILESKEKTQIVLKKALKFCRTLGNLPFVKKYFVEVPKLCDMINDVISGLYKDIPYASIVMVIVALIYMISPLDILPDVIPALGVTDDAAMIFLVLDTLRNDLENYDSWKKSQAT
jgi:uncharacterized membrane protein YkvA (DUF1232 family)